MLYIKNLNIQFNDEVILKDASFCALKGQITLIKGKSGIGKSTFLKSLIFEHPCHYEYDKMDLSSLDITMQKQFIYEKIGFVEQIPQFLNGMRLNEHVHQFEKLGYKRYLDIEEKLNIPSMLSKLPNNLSGGEKTRAAIYLAIMKQPDILILDEPTASLDKEYTDTVIDILSHYALDSHIVIIASHDKRIENHADTIYEVIDHQLISHKEIKSYESSLHSFQKSIEKKHQKISIKFGYRQFRYTMTCMVSLTMIILVYSSQIYHAFQNSYQSEIDKLSSTELLVYKPKYDNDYEYSYEGYEYPFLESEIEEIEEIENIEYVNTHIDLNYGNLIYSEYDEGINESEINNISLTDKNNNIIEEYNDETMLSYHSYNDSDLIDKRLSIKFQDTGIIISQAVYEKLSKMDSLDTPYLSFNLIVPIYNASNMVKIYLEDGHYDYEVNYVINHITQVTLPIKGVLKEDESLYNVSSYDYTIFIESNVYNSYVEEYKKNSEQLLYFVDIEDEDILNDSQVKVNYDVYDYGIAFYGEIPTQYSNYDILQTVIESPWSTNCLTVKVDDLSHMQSVIDNIENLGFRVNSEYANSSAISILSRDNQNILLVFLISVVVIIYAFYIYLKYLMLKEETNVRDYLSTLGLTLKEIQQVIQKNYFKNFVVLAIATCIILRVLIEIIVKIYIVQLIIAPKLIFFVCIILMSFILEILIPMLLQYLSAKTNRPVH